MKIPNAVLLVIFYTGFVVFPGFAIRANSQDLASQKSVKPVELDVIKSSIGTWDCEIEVWPQGTDNASIKFKGTETNKAFGDHWMSSDFVSEFQGQTMVVHSIVGYDLDKKQLTGKIIDHGPYAATMEGSYDAKSKTVTWKTYGKMPDGSKLFQLTTIEHKSDKERLLVLKNPTDKEGKFAKFMVIKYSKRSAKE